MNFSLPIYFTKSNLTSLYVDYSNVVLLPSICFFGILTSIACILGSYKRDESNSMAVCYIFINSLIDLLFLVIQFFLVIIRCGTLCPYGYTYASKIYELYVYLYIGYVLVNSQAIFNIYISYDRLKMFSANRETLIAKKLYFTYAVCVLIAAIANMPLYLMTREIVPFGVYVSTPNSTHSFEVLYGRIFRKQFQSEIWQNLLTASVVLKNPLVLIIYCVLNIFILIKFEKFFRKRKTLFRNRVVPSKLTLKTGIYSNMVFK